MRVRSNTVPSSSVRAELIEGIVVLTLWDGKFSVIEGDTEEFEYDIYQIPVPNRSNIVEVVESSFDVWYKAAVDRERLENQRLEKENIEKDILSRVIDTLLDYDFRLMMLEELNLR